MENILQKQTDSSSQAAPVPVLDFNASQVREFYRQKDYKKVCEQLLKALQFFRLVKPMAFNHEQRNFILQYIELLIEIFTDEDFQIPDFFVPIFITESVQIANLAALTPLKNTDHAIRTLSSQKNSYFKILTLYSYRNVIRLDLDMLFRAHPQLASLWWSNLLASAWNSNNELIFNNMQYFIQYKNLDKYFTYSSSLSVKFQKLCTVVFDTTYINYEKDLEIKKIINKAIQKDIGSRANVSVANPDYKKVVVISSFFFKGHAIHKSISPMVKSLKGHYHLTLIDINALKVDTDRELFDKVIEFNKVTREEHITKSLESAVVKGDFSELMKLNTKTNHLDSFKEILEENKFGIAFFPDVGLSQASIILSNFRFAPIQIAAYGHPVSTASNEIDYFIGGRDVEIADKAEENYSERLVLIPGLAALPVYPNYKLQNSKKPFDDVIINLNWGNIKFYYKHLLTLQKIIRGTKKNICLRFMSIYPHECGFVPFINDLIEFFNEKHVKMIAAPNIDFKVYMEFIEQSDFALDSFPFGGYNRIVDTLYCHKPIVTLEGTKAYNRLASALLRDVGLSELIATNEKEYIDKTLQLIEDDDYRNKISKKIASIDLKAKIFNTGKEKYLKKAFDYLVGNHHLLRQEKIKKPIIISED